MCNWEGISKHGDKHIREKILKESSFTLQRGAQSALLLLISTMLILTNATRAQSWDLSDAETKAYVRSLEETRETSQDEVFRELIAVIPEPDGVNKKRL
jgi:hypothetical protein